MRMKKTFLVGVIGLFAACGGSPSSPTPTSTTQSTTQATANPAPANEPTPPPTPTPAPTPEPTPSPTPVPTPVPVPGPPPAPAKTVLHATVAGSHWYPDANFTLPDRFDVTIEGDKVKIASLDPLPFSFDGSDADFIVRTNDFQFVVHDTTFTFNGVAGIASGTVSRD
jgi:hypothetical protein